MEQFSIQRLSPQLVRIGGLMHEFMYLVEGGERAALIDTGGGFGSLRQVVRSLTGKPLVVLLTHGHVDHAMGAGEFEDVWMDPRDIPVFYQHARQAFRIEALHGARPRLEQDPPMIPCADPRRFHPLRDGAGFDLGGVHLDVFECPGHTPAPWWCCCGNPAPWRWGTPAAASPSWAGRKAFPWRPTGRTSCGCAAGWKAGSTPCWTPTAPAVCRRISSTR